MAREFSNKELEWALLYESLRSDIFAFARALGMHEPTAQQAEVLKAVQEGAKFVAVKSGQGVGKTSIEGLVGLWRAFRFPMAQTVILAPTERQAKDRWLSEARSWIAKADPNIKKLFVCEATSIKIMGNRDWGVRIIPAGSGKSEVVQGEHNEHLSVLVDEASGIKRNILETIYGTVTNEDKLVGLFGNPNSRDCAFFDCFNRDRENWATYTFSSADSPIVDQKNVQRLINLYGEESDVVRVRVYGEFPDQDPDAVMSSDDLEACAKNSMFECSKVSNEKQFGIDLARFGSDESVIYRRKGLSIVEFERYAKTEPLTVIANAMDMQKRVKWRDDQCLFVFDADGMGQGKRPVFGKRNVHEFHTAGVASDSRQYDDRMTEAFFRLGHLVKQRAVYIPNDPVLIHQLSTRKYHVTIKGKLKVDSKEDWKKEQQETRSPDRSDACVMAFWSPHAGKTRVVTPKRRRARRVAV